MYSSKEKTHFHELSDEFAFFVNDLIILRIEENKGDDSADLQNKINNTTIEIAIKYYNLINR